MNATITSIKEAGTHKPLGTGSNPVAATSPPSVIASRRRGDLGELKRLRLPFLFLSTGGLN